MSGICDELKPCPFCGCEDIDEYEGDFGNGVYCMNCGAMMGEPIHMEFRTNERVSYEQAIEAWNTRTPEQAIAATLGGEINGDTSDGYHTFNELYHHRAVLFSVIVASHRGIAWKAKKHHDGTMYNGMFIVGIDTPWGQASYHYDIDPYWDMFDCEERETAPEWDGHTPDEAIERIGKLATLGGGKLTAEQVREAWCSNLKRDCLYDPPSPDWQAIADELNATLGGSGCETCHGESDLSEWVCSECQCWIPLGLTPENIERASEWRYCPHCGRKAVKR